jgi:hypothetical protein
MFNPRVRFGLTVLICVLGAVFVFVTTATRHNPSFEGRRIEVLADGLTRDVGVRVHARLGSRKDLLVLDLRYTPREDVYLNVAECALQMRELMELAAIRYTGFCDEVRVSAEASTRVPLLGVPAERSAAQTVAELRRRFDRKQILESGDRLWPIAATAYRPWRDVVIHHSATSSGSAASFERYHRNVRHWDQGLGYHFVIGNGKGSRDGQIEAGDRWTRQLQGAHAGVKRFNREGVGVCVVGNFATGAELAGLKKASPRKPGERSTPTRRQMESLRFLMLYLALRLEILPERILGHRDVKHTICPGGNFPMERLRREVRRDLLRLRMAEH